MVLLSHPTGNANVRNAALALADAGMLSEFWTCVSWNPDAPRSRLFPAGMRAQLERRAVPAALRPYVRTSPWREAGRLLADKLKLRNWTRHEKGIFSVDAVYRDLDRHVAQRLKNIHRLRAVHAYDDGALETFRMARHNGIPCVHELSAGYWRALHQTLREEAEREPDWAPTLLGIQDSPAKLARKDEELALADHILVASSFARKSLDFAPQVRAKIHLLPYGAPVSLAPVLPQEAGKRLRVLYVGSLEQRKGISYLFKALDLVADAAELTVVGKRAGDACPALESALARHRHIPSLPFNALLKLYAEHDVLVFPSVFDAFGLVILEAMAQGVPVITTPHTAGPDIIDDGRDGFIVPIRAPEAIAEKLLFLAANRDALQAMRQAAMDKAARFTWETYRQNYIKTLTHALGVTS